ncbi:unnamed protein product [Xylocopa violacea]|uniref:Fanconi-associated nuclease n=1 Tax=Xylocopa violacea TaxID=135666 RepID=A0ABP1N0R4_XYLVO
MLKQTCIDQYYKSAVKKRASNTANVKVHSTATSSKNKRRGIRTSRNVRPNTYSSVNEVLEICLDEDTSPNDCEIIEHYDCLPSSVDTKHERKRNILNTTNEIDLKISKRINDDQLKITLSNTPVKVQAIHNCDSNNHLKGTPSDSQSSPDRNDLSLRTLQSNNSFSTPHKSNYTYKVQSGKSPETVVRKKLFDDRIDTEIINQSIEHLNLAKQGAIPQNSFKLEEIYSKTTFNYQYSGINSKTQIKYELDDINICDDLNSKVLFTTIFNVFSNPINCGYFDENELDFIYSILTLSADAQKLLVSMIKRKKGWFRKSNLPEITENMEQELVSHSICTFDIKSVDLHQILTLLQVDELRQLCQKMNFTSKGNKEDNIKKLLQLAKNKPLFPGIKDPTNSLYDSILNILGYCVCLTTKTWDIINKIITLLLPNNDPKFSMADTFYMLSHIYLRKIIYPNNSGYTFPVFSNSVHLMSYIDAKSTLSATLKYIREKKWKAVLEHGNSAMNVLPQLLENDSITFKNFALPMHVRRYNQTYLWLKILNASIDAFKKVGDKKQAVEALNLLLNQNYYLHDYRGKWYADLALIEMHHLKNIEVSASIIMQALGEEKLTLVDNVCLLERANKIYKRKTGVNSNTKAFIKNTLDDNNHLMSKYKAASITIHGTLIPTNKSGNKSVWCIENKKVPVETVALHYYRDQGFPKGLHCEGALPIALFFTLFWEELYDMHIPGAFVTPYSEAPGDLFTEEFYKNRKEKIDLKLTKISTLNSKLLSSWMGRRYHMYSQYQSAMSSLQDLEMTEIVHCLGTNGVVGICKRLIENYKLWKAGFPDLIVWNYETKKHKIVEVKGPRDVLSTKQQLWLEYLYQLELNVELCLVEDKYNEKRKNETMHESEMYYE